MRRRVVERVIEVEYPGQTLLHFRPTSLQCFQLTQILQNFSLAQLTNQESAETHRAKISPPCQLVKILKQLAREFERVHAGAGIREPFWLSVSAYPDFNALSSLARASANRIWLLAWTPVSRTCREVHSSNGSFSGNSEFSH